MGSFITRSEPAADVEVEMVTVKSTKARRGKKNNRKHHKRNKLDEEVPKPTEATKSNGLLLRVQAWRKGSKHVLVDPRI